MATIVTKILEDRIKGDGSDKIEFEATDDVGDGIDLAGATIRSQFRLGGKLGEVAKDNSIGDGITVTDEAEGLFEIDAFKIEWAVGKYYWDIQITMPAKDPKTYVEGTMKLLQDTTYGN